MDQLELWNTDRALPQGPVDAPSPGIPRTPTGLELWLREQVARPLRLVLTNNRSTMLSWYERDGVAHLRLHRMFTAAEEVVLNALARYLRDNDNAAGRLVDEFISENAPRAQTPAAEVRVLGMFHNLAEILDDLNERFFHGACRARITWGTAGRRRARRSIQLGCYIADERLIRIHPCLDQAFVPQVYVAWVVFHEMLHELFGVEHSRHGRRSLHPPEFLALEQTFPDYQLCKRWERANLDRLLCFRGPG